VAEADGNRTRQRRGTPVNGTAIAELTTAESPATETENAIPGISRTQSPMILLAVPWACDLRGFDPDLLHALHALHAGFV
jgi:hypothetical protein